MQAAQAESLRKAIEALVDAKLLDAMSKPGGLDRLLAYRATGVAPFGVRVAQRNLQNSIQQVLEGDYAEEDAMLGRRTA